MFDPDFDKLKPQEAIAIIIIVPLAIVSKFNNSEISDSNDKGTETHSQPMPKRQIVQVGIDSQLIRNPLDGSFTNTLSIYNLNQMQHTISIRCNRI